jgi:hypothetical protein
MASRVPAVVVALVIVFGLYLVLPRPDFRQPERVAEPPPAPGNTPDQIPKVVLKSVDPDLVKLQTSGSAVQRDFARGLFEADDPLEKLLSKHTPLLRYGDTQVVILVYDPADWGGERTDRTQVVAVFAMEGKLLQAMTRVRTGSQQYRMLTFLTGIGPALIGAAIDARFWESVDAILDLWHPAVLPARMAIAGCPVVVDHRLLVR